MCALACALLLSKIWPCPDSRCVKPPRTSVISSVDLRRSELTRHSRCRRTLSPSVQVLQGSSPQRRVRSTLSSLWTKSVSMWQRCLCMPGSTFMSAPWRLVSWASCWSARHQKSTPLCPVDYTKRLKRPNQLTCYRSMFQLFTYMLRMCRARCSSVKHPDPIIQQPMPAATDTGTVCLHASVMLKACFSATACQLFGIASTKWSSLYIIICGALSQVTCLFL